LLQQDETADLVLPKGNHPAAVLDGRAGGQGGRRMGPGDDDAAGQSGEGLPGGVHP
jgi:hypothetical protein